MAVEVEASTLRMKYFGLTSAIFEYFGCLDEGVGLRRRII